MSGTLIHPIPSHNPKIGIMLIILSNILFSVLYLYSGFLAPMSGTEVFVWRILMMFFVIFLWLALSGQLATILEDIKQLTKTPKSLLWLLIPVPIMLSQLWLFMWAPINGQGVAVAMGYFLFPLMMVLMGCLIFKERLVGLQKIAVLFASIGVLSEFIQGGSLSWATLWVCGTYPIYYIIRRRQKVRAITGLFVDTGLFLPIGILYLVFHPTLALSTVSSLALFKVIGLGLISVLAFTANLQALRLLPVNVFGMLSYLEPLLLFVLAVTLLGEPLTLQMLSSYGLIWIGIVCLIGYGVKRS